MKYSICISDIAVNTPFGNGIEPLWKNLIAGNSAIQTCTRFNVDNMIIDKASFIDFQQSDDSLIWHILLPIKEQIKSWNADYLILATTKGEIDLIHKSITNFPKLNDTLNKALKFFNINSGCVVSAACASSNIAIAQAAEHILNASAKRIAVIGVDIVSKFVFSGFSALQALSADKSSKNPAKPFDVFRDGLVLGEAAAAMLITSEPVSQYGVIRAWSAASDANHVTGPSRDGSGLSNAISKALTMGNITPDEIAAVSAHGTGTKYNDAMEMHAFKAVFENQVPVFSIKGALGHTMGASGILESIISLKALQQEIIPPTCGFTQGDELSTDWVSSKPQNINGQCILKTNSGFGGINAAVIFSKN